MSASAPAPSAAPSASPSVAPAASPSPAPPARDDVDVVIVGGGIVGLAAAHQLADIEPDRRILVLEKEAAVAQHQTGRNSGVIHSGIYYVPGSLKARTCRAGKAMLESFCEAEGVPFDRCGKVIVATHPSEYDRLDTLLERGRANGVTCRLIDGDELRDREPHVAGDRAILVDESGIVDYVAMCERMVERLHERGHAVVTGARVTQVRRHQDGVVVRDHQGRSWRAGRLVNCGGLYSDRIARIAGTTPDHRIVPFRGEYYELRSDARHLCRHLIYPVPDPAFPFLGVHFTRMIDGSVECGPNAVLALAREGYDWRTVNVRDLLETLASRGFQKLAARYWRTGCGEIRRSLRPSAFVTALQRLIPDVRLEQLERAPAGVRAQALAEDGSLADDFVIHDDAPCLHVVNAPSPAATASLAIGQRIATMVANGA